MKMFISSIYGTDGIRYVAQQKVAEIAYGMGFQATSIYLYPTQTDTYSELIKRIDGITAGIGNGDVLVLQLPTWNFLDFEKKLVNRVKERGTKVILFVHDVTPLMFEVENWLLEGMVEFYNSADGLIMASQGMVDYLRNYGLTNQNIVVHHLFDHPTNIELYRPTFKKRIHLAGNLERYPFADDWNYSIPLSAYGKPKNIQYPSTVDVRGMLLDEELMIELSKGGFGLCWSIDLPNNKERRYSRLNASYKVSTYLASGIPIIANSDISCAKLIEDNHLGILANNIEEAVFKIEQMTEEEYAGYIKSVEQFAQLLRNGFFTRKALTDSVFSLLKK